MEQLMNIQKLWSSEFMIFFIEFSMQGVAIAIVCGLIGFFALGVYPLGLELIVECTYPVDQVGTYIKVYFLTFSLENVP